MTSNQNRSRRPITMQDQMGEARRLEDRGVANPLTLTAVEESEIIEAAEKREEEPEQYVEKIASLERIIDGQGEEFSNDELLALGIGYGIPGPLSDEQIRREAQEALEEMGR